MEYQHLQQKHLKEKISAPFMTGDYRTFLIFFQEIALDNGSEIC